jgi:DNA-binding transcriptional regulator LsrR (DeoR family)
MSPKRFYKNMNLKKAEEARIMYFNEKKKQREIAIYLGISQGSVSRIISGLSW